MRPTHQDSTWVSCRDCGIEYLIGTDNVRRHASGLCLSCAQIATWADLSPERRARRSSGLRPSPTDRDERGRFKAVAVLAAALLAGCAVVPEVITRPQIVEVKVEVSRPCPALGKVGEAPRPTPNADLARMDDFDLVLALAEDRARLAAYAAVAAPAISGCLGETPAPAPAPPPR